MGTEAGVKVVGTISIGVRRDIRDSRLTLLPYAKNLNIDVADFIAEAWTQSVHSSDKYVGMTSSSRIAGDD